ncbi:MAG: hypothetical protein JW884_14250 [Deltaproteobacteria bacterium]|nr:hypothetical protein [Deltaproteobacteria bacterium]
MKDEIDGVKNALRNASVLSYVRDADIFITENEYLIPNSVKSHAIGVKDGREIRRELPGGMMERTINVKVIAYVQLVKPGAALMGDAAGKKGILEMSHDIDTVLDENLLDIDGMQSAFCRDIEESDTIGDDDTGDVFVKKTMLYEYVKEEERP